MSFNRLKYFVNRGGTGRKDSNAIFYFLGYMYRFSEGKRKWLLVYSFLFLLTNFADQLDKLLVGYIFNSLQIHGVSSDNIVRLMLLICLILLSDLLGWGTHGPARVIEQRLAQFMSENFRKYLYRNTLALSLTFHNAEHSGQIISKISKGVVSLERFASSSFIVIRVAFQLIAILVTLAVFNFKFALCGLVLMVLIYIIIWKFEKIINPLRDQINKHDNVISEILFDTISNITTIKMLSLSRIVGDSLNKELESKYEIFKRKSVLSELKWYTPSLISTLFIVGVMLTYVYNIYSVGSALMIGTLYILYGYLANLKNIMYEFAWMIGDIQEQYRDVKNSELLSDNFSKINNDEVKQASNIQSLEISNLQFRYSEAFDLSIESLKLEKGQSYAFVGESGCGKTTTMKILASLVECEKYTMRVQSQPPLSTSPAGGEEPLRNADAIGAIPLPLREGLGVGVESRGSEFKVVLENIRDSVMLVPQEPELFSNSIRENITLGLPYTEKEVNDVLDMVNMRETVEGLPDGIESKVYEKGVNLSGGQKQRLALARGILFAKDKEIILLDEPTSSVDQDNEERIYKELLTMCKDKILISSVHKRHLLSMFDHIVYFEKGKIVRVE